MARRDFYKSPPGIPDGGTVRTNDAYDNETSSIAQMEQFIIEQGYTNYKRVDTKGVYSLFVI